MAMQGKHSNMSTKFEPSSQLQSPTPSHSRASSTSPGQLTPAAASPHTYQHLASSPAKYLLPFQHLLLELDQEHRLPGPHSLAFRVFPALILHSHAVSRDTLGRKTSAVAHTFYYPCYKRGAIQTRKFPRQRYVRVDHGFVIEQQVLRLILVRALQSIGRPAEKVPVESLRDELEERKNPRRSDRGERVGGAGEEEIEKADADGVALVVQPFSAC